MSTMTTQISKSARARGEAPEPFVELCKRLYGNSIDAQEVWDDVFKRSPDQADLHAQRAARTRRNVERGSNAVGIAAGSLGLAGALKDDRLQHAGAGRVSRTLAATGRKMPKVFDRVKNPRVRAGLAGAAVATQVANLGGDALIAGTLKDSKVGKSDLRLVPTGNVEKSISLAKLPKLDKISTGIQRGWKAMTPTPLPAGGRAAKIPGKPVQGPLTQGQTRARNAGADVASALNTTSGKAMAGTLAVAGAGKANGAAKRRSQGVEYAPDVYGKADEDVVDVEFGGTFSKFDDDKRQVFGWASVVKLNGMPVVDRQGDYIDPQDLEDAAYQYVHKSRVGGDMHKRTEVDQAHKVSDMIESMVFTPDKIEKMGLPADFPVGWWVGYQIHDEPTWDLVKKRGRTGFSIHGRGLRKAADLDQLMGYTQ